MYTSNAYTWTDLITQSFQNTWGVIIGFLPSLIAALIVLIVGVLIASVLRSVFSKIISALKIDALLRKVHVEDFLHRGGFQLDSGRFVGGLVYWFFVIVIVLAASDILGLWGLSSFLGSVLLYFPNIIVAVLIVLAAVIVANFLRTLVRGSIKSAKLHASKFLGALTWWATVVFGFLAALLQLGIAAQLIQTMVTGIIAMIALAGGIAFGLGGKEYAASLINTLKNHSS